MIHPEIAARQDQIVEDFHRLYYDDFEGTWEQTRWMGVKVLKCPMDLWLYQEILWEMKPDFVLETGTAHGGSALYMADLMDRIGHGQILTVDIAGMNVFPQRPSHPRIEYVLGSSVDSGIVEYIHNRVNGGRVLIILDSNHSKDHVCQELKAYFDLVRIGDLLIVEDTNVHGHPVSPEHPEGPMEGIQEFFKTNWSFKVDRDMEKFHLTFNPSGYLRRVA